MTASVLGFCCVGFFLHVCCINIKPLLQEGSSDLAALRTFSPLFFHTQVKMGSFCEHPVLEPPAKFQPGKSPCVSQQHNAMEDDKSVMGSALRSLCS